MKNLKEILEASWKIGAVIIIAYFAITFNSGGCKPDKVVERIIDTVVVTETVELPPKTVRLPGKVITIIDTTAINQLNRELQAKNEEIDSLQLIYNLAQSFEADTTLTFVKFDSTNVALNDTVWVDIYVKANPIDKIIDMKIGIKYSDKTTIITETIRVQEGETFWDAIMGLGEDIVKVTAGVLVGYIIASVGG